MASAIPSSRGADPALHPTSSAAVDGATQAAAGPQQQESPVQALERILQALLAPPPAAQAAPHQPPEAELEGDEAQPADPAGFVRIDPAQVAQELIGRVTPPDLDLRGLSEQAQACVEAMPASAWAELQRHALQGGGAGITSVTLGAELDATAVAAGLPGLADLRRIFIPANTRNPDIDLMALHGSALESVLIEGDAERELVITVPHGAEAEAIKTTRAALSKSRVLYGDSDGTVDPGQKGRPLHGQFHDRVAHDYVERMAPEAAQGAAGDIKLNGAAAMDVVDAASGKTSRKRIVCRQLVVMWLRLRMAYHQTRRRGDTFKFGQFLSPQRIRAGMPADVERDIERMVASRPLAVCEPSAGPRVPGAPPPLNELLELAFTGLQPGQRGYFALTTDDPYHMMGLEVRIKETWHGSRKVREYVANLYDPDRTATHRRVVVGDLSKLKALDLRNWIPGTGLASLYRWPPGAADAGAQPIMLVSETTRLSGRFLHAALHDGLAAVVPTAVQDLVDHAPDQRQLEEALLATISIGPRPHRGAHRVSWQSFPDPPTFEAYVQAILDISPSKLDAAAKLRVLQAQWEGKGLLHCIVGSGHPESVAPYMERILGAQAEALLPGGNGADADPADPPGPRNRTELLLSRNDAGQPMLARLSAERPDTPMGGQRQRHKAMQAVVGTAARSAVPLDERKSICAAFTGSGPAQVSAAKLALDAGNLGAAAAIVLGACESPDANALLDHMDVSVGEVIERFRATSFVDADRAWADETIGRLQAQLQAMPADATASAAAARLPPTASP